MTDNEIVKACKDCLHYEACKGTYSSAKGDEDILYDFDGEMYANSGCEDFQDKNLIKRLQAENEKKDRAFKELIEVARLWKEKYNNTKAENDTLKNVIKNTFLEQAGCEIDPLAEIKAEAYKEFAERLKLRFSGTLCCSGEVIKRAVDNLLKELVGEQVIKECEN